MVVVKCQAEETGLGVLSVIKVEDMNGQMVPHFGISPEKFCRLAELIQKVLTRKDHVIVCITGNKSAGKTTLGKLIRKKGESVWPNLLSYQGNAKIAYGYELTAEI